MYILLLGGTGPMGIHLSKMLSQEGDQVYVTSRKSHTDIDNIHYIQGNARDIDFVSSVLSKRRWDCVVDFMVYSTNDFKDRVEILLSSTKKYVFLSSARVYDDRDEYITENSTRLLDTSEDTLFLSTDEYALYKAREEDVLLNSSYDNFIILRPYITYAENRFPLGMWEKETWLRRCLSRKDLVLPQKFLTKQTSIAYGRDVSFVIKKLLKKEETTRQAYNVVSDESCSWLDILEFYIEEIEKITNYRPKIIKVDTLVTDYKYMLKLLLKDVITLGRKKYWKQIKNERYQLIYDRDFNRKFDNTKLKCAVNDFCFTGYKQNLGKCLENFVIKQTYNNINWAWEAVQDKLTGSSTSLSQIPDMHSRIKYILIRYFIPTKYIKK